MTDSLQRPLPRARLSLQVELMRFRNQRVGLPPIALPIGDRCVTDRTNC